MNPSPQTSTKTAFAAGILGVGFDELKRRDRKRARWRQVRMSVVVLLGVLLYVLLVDMGAPFPFAITIQRWLDERELSVARHALSEAALTKKISALRSTTISAELGDIEEQLVFTPDNKGRIGGTWGLGQMIAGIAAAPEATPADLARAKHWIEFIFNPGRATDSHGVAYGWLLYQLKNPQAEAALWPIIALSASLARPDALSPNERAHFVDHLRYAQRAASLYYSSGGGWDHLPNLKNKGQDYRALAEGLRVACAWPLLVHVQTKIKIHTPRGHLQAGDISSAKAYDCAVRDRCARVHCMLN